MEDLHIALIQSDLYWEEAEANTAMFEERIWEIDETDLIVLPEMFTTGFSMKPEKLSEPVGGRTFKWMRQVALQKDAAIAGSYIVKEGNNYFNRLYFVFPDGTSLYYDKKHLFSLAGESQKYTAGNEKLIVSYKGWRICPMICYDLRFPIWSRSNTVSKEDLEYDLLIYCANWPEARINAWDTLLKARAIENLSYCVGVNRIGKDGNDKNYPGHSAIYSFKGEEMGFVSQSETVFAQLSAEELTKFRKRYPFHTDADSFIIN